MNLLDTIVLAFQSAIQTGTSTLALFSLPLLAVLGTIALYTALYPYLLQGGGMGDALGATLFQLIKTGIFYWLLVNLTRLANSALLTFFSWGAAAGEGRITPLGLLKPSTIVTIGQQATYPLAVVIDRLGGLWFTHSPWIALTYHISSWIILGSFVAVAITLAMTLLEFYFAVMVATVLLPWGILSPVAFLAEFAIGFITGGLVRVLLTAAIVGIATPLFLLVSFPVGGGDPTAATAVTTAIAAILFAILAWVIPNRAAGIAGRGVSLALTGSTLIASASGAGRFVAAGVGAVRGVSRLVQQARA